MARRKSAAKRESEFIDAVLKMSSIGVFAIVLLMTKSLKTAFIFGLIGFIVSIIFLIVRSKNYKDKVRKSRINDVDSMTGTQFEYFLKLLFIRQGYKVETTKVTGDYGADLVMTKDGKKIVVQVKRYSNRVGIKAIQEVVSSIAFYKATEGWAITNNEFTDAAIELANSNGIRLIERDELINMISQLNGSSPEEAVKESINYKPKELCIKCGSEMVLRKGKRGEFYGCINFPKCRYTRNVGS
ncbi:restriction endonuclease [Neobacillus sp. LXY-4]|uniref:restriction endonuclease n=1 Tax=Neobacillus sp. LXY-4 TaxID=3379826 RepID=UPI003EE236AA